MLTDQFFKRRIDFQCNYFSLDFFASFYVTKGNLIPNANLLALFIIASYFYVLYAFAKRIKIFRE